MNLSHCENERAVLEAAQLGRWDDELAGHVAKCPVCADVALVAHFLQRLDESDRIEAKPPDAGTVWWKAQLLAKRAAAERATQPIAMIERLGYACVALSALALAAWQWPRIHAWVGWLSGVWSLGGHLLRDFLLISWSSLSFIAILSASAFLLFLTFVVYLVWAED